MTIHDESEGILTEISNSLKPARLRKIGFDELKSKVTQAKTADPSLFNLPRFCDEILKFISDRELETDLDSRLDGFAVNMQQVTESITDNLMKIKSVESSLAERLRNFNVMEEKYQRMINRVDSVLGELETVLRRS